MRSAAAAALLLLPLSAVGVAVPASAAPTCGGLRATVVGSDRADILVGTPGRDVIVGRGGDDAIDGRGGRDVICGDAGKDLLRGSGGGDRLFGGDDADRLEGGAGPDLLRGERGGDQLRGEAGDDDVDTGASGVAGLSGPPLLRDAPGLWSARLGALRTSASRGEPTPPSIVEMLQMLGLDIVFGDAGDDRLVGRARTALLTYEESPAAVVVDGADRRVSGLGTDRYTDFALVAGTRFADRMIGGAAADNFEGGAGADLLVGNAGMDMLDGGPGADTVRAGDGMDLVTAFGDTASLGRGHDLAVARGGTVFGGPGSDVLLPFGSTTVNGGTGADTIAIFFGAVTVMRQQGEPAVIDLAQGYADYGFRVGLTSIEDVIGSDGPETIIGNGRRNFVDAGPGDDTLRGLGADDALIGGPGSDSVDGGAGTDICTGETVTGCESAATTVGRHRILSLLR